MTTHPGKFCRTEPDGIVHHGWDCDEADPMSDLLSAMVGPEPDNPILAASWQKMVDRWTGGE